MLSSGFVRIRPSNPEKRNEESMSPQQDQNANTSTKASSKASALDGVRVVEFGTMISGPYCGKLLADLGADVVKVEAPEGDPARRHGPFPDDESHPERSALFLYLNTSKRGVTLDLSVEADLDAFKKLLRWADALIDNHAPDVLAGYGLDWDSLHALNPRLVYTSITPYGRSGPRANTPGDELTLVHAAGLGNLLPTRSKDASRAPIKPGGNPMGYHGGLAAGVATLAALRASGKTGVGTLVDISLQEAMLAMIGTTVASVRYHGSTWHRVPDRPPAMGRMKTSDGYVILNALDDHHFAALRELMGNPEWCADDAWNNMAYRANNIMDIAGHIDAWMLKQKKDDIHHKAAAKRIPIGPVNTAQDVMNYPQFEAREYFVEVDHPEVGTYRYAGWPYKLPASPPRIQRPAPRLGEHNEDILSGSFVETPIKATSKSSDARSSSLPLEGIRVLEFAWVLAGPYCGMLLAQLGAEVIKVESHKRTGLMRRAVVWPLPDAAPSVVPPNEGLAFNSVNMNKKSVTLDLSKPEGVALARKLVAESDIVFNNMRPGALDKLGLGYDDLRKVRPDIIAATASGRGSVGPDSQYLGYAMLHHALGGNTYITGYPDDPPCHTTGDVDIMNATTLAFALLAAIHHRDRTGEGQFIDFSQAEAVTSLIGEVLLGYELTSRIPERMGNEHPLYAPHAVYRAWGVDRWLAIEIHDDEEFARLVQVMGRPELANDPRFADAQARKKNEKELDRIVEAWTCERDRDRTVSELVAAGIAAAPSRDARDLYADPHLKARGAFVTVNHPDLGDLDLVGPPWKMSGFQVKAARAPFLGEHNDEVLKGLAGLSDDDLNRLRENEIIR
ncbi:MAG: CoA transferase [Candidatus Hydrogenedentes bacterium]|nr:CoA transferase [Candidatus Hydrogenedentota bacterium]